jgi:hypothetical protein
MGNDTRIQQSFVSNNPKGRNHFKNVGTGKRIILKEVFKHREYVCKASMQASGLRSSG